MDGGSAARWLLIGNSRWHWAGLQDGELISWHAAPTSAPVEPVHAWAAVGPVPAGADLPQERRLLLADVPLREAPPWLGIDRALAGWLAWRERGGPVLVADAGTVLSLTRVDGSGRFAGGRLMAGLALQLRAMAAGTQDLPPPLPNGAVADLPDQGAESWPQETAAAMAVGVRRGMAAAVVAATLEVAQREPEVGLVLTGGDGEQLLPLIAEGLADRAPVPLLRPALCLEALAALRPLRPERDR
ncbi:type III pantothenate kinase [Cyanobium sp. FGCU-52]|nr:type III pantothenate kinase [Cyanobium sp. FGCU52]